MEVKQKGDELCEERVNSHNWCRATSHLLAYWLNSHTGLWLAAVILIYMKGSSSTGSQSKERFKKGVKRSERQKVAMRWEFNFGVNRFPMLNQLVLIKSRHSSWYSVAHEHSAPAEPANCLLGGYPAISVQQFNKQAGWTGIDDGLADSKLWEVMCNTLTPGMQAHVFVHVLNNIIQQLKSFACQHSHFVFMMKKRIVPNNC